MQGGGEGVEVKLVLPPHARAAAAVNSPEIARCITPLVQGEHSTLHIVIF